MTSLVSLRAALNKATPQEVTRAVRDTHGHAFVDAEAALIVAAVNALPALLNIAQAAQTFLNASYSAQNGYCVDDAWQVGDAPFVERRLTLREALAALDKEQT